MSSQRRLAAIVLVVAAVAVAAVIALNVPLGGGGSVPGSSDVVIGSPLLNKPAPDFTLTTLDGRSVSLFDYVGRPVIVNFWASWCIPCRDEFPQFVTALSEHKADGLEILGIVHLDGSDTANAFASAHGGTWPMLQDADNSTWNAYLGVGVPSTYFIDRQGVVRATSLGPITATSLPLQIATIIPRSDASSVP